MPSTALPNVDRCQDATTIADAERLDSVEDRRRHDQEARAITDQALAVALLDLHDILSGCLFKAKTHAESAPFIELDGTLQLLAVEANHDGDPRSRALANPVPTMVISSPARICGMPLLMSLVRTRMYGVRCRGVWRS
ncbi:MAG: hypothetical protein U0163_07490 [Gemmatimonadaceae bacterium]